MPKGSGSRRFRPGRNVKILKPVQEVLQRPVVERVAALKRLFEHQMVDIEILLSQYITDNPKAKGHAASALLDRFRTDLRAYSGKQFFSRVSGKPTSFKM